MLTPQSLEALLDRLRQLVSRSIGDPVESLEHEQLAVVPWNSWEQALTDTTLLAVAFANQRGGDILLGIQRSGQVTGVGTEAQSLVTALFARTRPGIVADVWSFPTDDGILTVVSVPEGHAPHATADGTRVRRVGRTNLPITPDQDLELVEHKGELDYTDRPLAGSSTADLDPAQLHYLREIVRRRNDQSELLELDNEQLLHSLQLLTPDGQLKVAALLLLGNRRVLKERLPQAEVVYLHMGPEEEPDLHESLTMPLLHTLSRLQDLIEARNRFTILRQGLFQFQIKDFDENVYREALVNALVHRDYARRDGSVHVTHAADRLEISNPGTLMGGITVDNILYHPPRHRNRRLTEVLQHLGLMERAGMGVNRLYRYLLRAGKEAPVYEVSADAVRLTIQAGNMDETFATFVQEEEAQGRMFSLDMLILLSALKRQKVIERAQAAQLAQRPERVISNSLSRMIDLGYLERLGAGRGSAYRLAPTLYARFGSKVRYFRDRGLSRRRQLSLLLEVATELGGVTLEDAQELCGVTRNEAERLLSEAVEKHLLARDDGRWIPLTDPSPEGEPES